MVRTVAFTLAAISVAPLTALSAQLTQDTARRIDGVFAAVDRTDRPGCVVGVNRDTRSLFRRGYGMASLEFGVPLTEHSVLESGSVAKQFAAGAIVRLAQTGKLGLDDPVRKYVPELPDYGAPITVRMLLNHTSGIRDMWTLFNVAGQSMGTVLFTMDRALRMVYRQRELNFPPNSQFLYSNSGYLLLAEIVHRVGGGTLAEYSRDTFFRPLGMRRTQWRDDWNQTVADRATAYSPVEKRWRVDMPYMSVYGAGGLLTTVGDLLLWNEELANPRIGGKAWTDSLERRGRLTSGRELGYALGLFVGSHRGEREVSHTGATGGYRTYLGRFPNRALSIAVLCNYGSANPEEFGHRVADVFLAPRDTTPAGSQAVAATPNISRYLGRYRDPGSESVITMVDRDGRLARAGGSPPLVPAGPDRFSAAGGAVTVAFHPVRDGKATGLTLTQPGEDSTHYERLTPPPSTARGLTGFLGSYHSDELDVSYRIEAKDTTLTVTIAGDPPFDLSRYTLDSFGGANGLALRFTRRAGRVTGFLLFAGRVKNLRFQRTSTR
ncbi:MAG: serine hydrolase domain-containing protein [Gemmatimonadales bacterium]